MEMFACMYVYKAKGDVETYKVYKTDWNSSSFNGIMNVPQFTHTALDTPEIIAKYNGYSILNPYTPCGRFW